MFFPICVTMCNYCVICSPARKEEKTINLGKIMESNRRRGRIFNGAFGNLVAWFGPTFLIQLLVSFLLQLLTCFVFFFLQTSRTPSKITVKWQTHRHTGVYRGLWTVYILWLTWPSIDSDYRTSPEVQTNGHSVHGFLSAKDTFSSIFFEAALSVLRFCKRRDSNGLV